MQFYSILIISITILVFASNFADSKERLGISYCLSSKVSHIDVPIYPDRNSSNTFSYAYQYIPSHRANAATVIVLPGGPGGTLIGSTSNQSYPTMALPSGWFNTIYTDPRGAGCNQNNFSTDALKTSYLAKDVVSLIKKLELKNYFIAGVSYGTVLGTEVVSLIEKENLALPRALILEGTMGYAWPDDFKSYIDEFNKDWKRVLAPLPESVGEQLSQDSLPFGLSANAWGAYIYNSLISGDVPGKGHLLQLELYALASKNLAALNQMKMLSFRSFYPKNQIVIMMEMLLFQISKRL